MMDRMRLLWRFLPVMGVLGFGAAAFAQPRLVAEKPFGYQVGDTVDSALFVLDKQQKPVPLRSLIRPETKVVVLVALGGAAISLPADRRHRGPLWCEDSLDDLSVQRALVAAFQHSRVQFLAVAVPPVYNPAAYGYRSNAFLGFRDEDPEFIESARQFIDATEKQVASGLLPFKEVYYDPKYRLAGKLKSGEGGFSESERYPWEGKLRWHADPRNYGLPIIWLLGPRGEILREPFFSNDWDSDPPQVRYEFRDVKAAIEEHLGGSQ